MARKTFTGEFSSNPQINRLVNKRLARDNSRRTTLKEPELTDLKPREELEFIAKQCVPALQAYATDLLKKASDASEKNTAAPYRRNAFLIRGALPGMLRQEPELLCEDGRIGVLQKCLKDACNKRNPECLPQHFKELVRIQERIRKIVPLQKIQPPSFDAWAKPAVKAMPPFSNLPAKDRQRLHLKHFADAHADILLQYLAKDLVTRERQEDACYIRGLLKGIKEDPALLLKDGRFESLMGICDLLGYTALNKEYKIALETIRNDLGTLKPLSFLEKEARSFFAEYIQNLGAFGQYIETLLGTKQPADRNTAFTIFGALAGTIKGQNPRLLLQHNRPEMLLRIMNKVAENVSRWQHAVNMADTLQEMETNARADQKKTGTMPIPPRLVTEQKNRINTILDASQLASLSLEDELKYFANKHLRILDDYADFLQSMVQHTHSLDLHAERQCEIFKLRGVLANIESVPGLLLIDDRLETLKTMVTRAFRVAPETAGYDFYHWVRDPGIKTEVPTERLMKEMLGDLTRIRAKLSASVQRSPSGYDVT